MSCLENVQLPFGRGYNGYPQVFVITRKDIAKGDELAVFYGRDYGHSVHHMQGHEQFMARVHGLVNSITEIIGDISDDHYIIDI